MWKALFVAVLAVALGTGRPALAQPSPGKADIKKLEVDLEKLKDQLKEAEARLQKAKEPKDEKKAGPPFGPWGKGPWAGKNPEEFKKKMEEFKKFAEKSGADKKGPPPFGPWGAWDPAKMKEMREKFEKARAEADKKPAASTDAKKESKGPPHGFGRGPGGPHGDWHRRGPERTAAASSSSDIERRLDRILREVEELRKEIKKK